MDDDSDKVIWVDSDPHVEASILQKAGFQVLRFTEVQDAMAAITSQKGITAVITSSMKRDGRAEKGLPSGFDLANFVRRHYAQESYKPLLCFITASADQQEVLECGFSIYVKYDRERLQNETVKMLQGATNRDFRCVRARGMGCSWKSRDFARAIVDFILERAPINFSAFHSSFSDLCFCTSCEPQRMMTRANSKYALPTGWFGFGIHIRDDFLNQRSKIENWLVAYHGTSLDRIFSILNERKIMFPGDTLKDGTVLAIKHGNCGAKKPAIYVSPTICYATHPVYAPAFSFQGKYVQVALQCRVKPGSFEKYHETLGNLRHDHIDPEIRKSGVYDPEFSDQEIEWIAYDKEGVVPYRLLVRWWDNGNYNK